MAWSHNHLYDLMFISFIATEPVVNIIPLSNMATFFVSYQHYKNDANFSISCADKACDGKCLESSKTSSKFMTNTPRAHFFMGLRSGHSYILDGKIGLKNIPPQDFQTLGKCSWPFHLKIRLWKIETYWQL